MVLISDSRPALIFVGDYLILAPPRKVVEDLSRSSLEKEIRGLTGGDNQKILETSYNASLSIAKCSAAETISEILIKPAAKIMAEVPVGDGAKQTFDRFSLSNNTVHRRIIDMSKNRGLERIFSTLRTEQSFTMWITSLFIFCSILLSSMNIVVSGEGSAITGKEAEEYDEKLSEFIKEILENFRDQMHEGIVDIGIPPIDPLVIPNINENIDDGIAQMLLRMRDINITGISKFHIEDLRADLEKGFANISISLPELTVDGYCFMNGKILRIFPINSDGPFFIHVTEVKIVGFGDLNVTTGGETRIHMNDLKLNLTFGPLEIEFKSLLGGGRWTQMLVKILSGLGRKLFLHFHTEAMAELNKALLKLINRELDKGTLSELLDQIPMAFPKQVKIKFM
ncbi:uncharacterized protein NPIL_665361 [Nephila pilipes]|uniref:Uncharacterized protein n=1 Tax=Nephila pilipes TaxID=299642 RepID=A0A8X6TJA8_NEPPI|nr:uncharacterized protein NPIL_665361 [Nephila pilipes]